MIAEPAVTYLFSSGRRGEEFDRGVWTAGLNALPGVPRP
jgi:hypothetical protein